MNKANKLGKNLYNHVSDTVNNAGYNNHAAYHAISASVSKEENNERI